MNGTKLQIPVVNTLIPCFDDRAQVGPTSGFLIDSMTKITFFLSKSRSLGDRPPLPLFINREN